MQWGHVNNISDRMSHHLSVPFSCFNFYLLFDFKQIMGIPLSDGIKDSEYVLTLHVIQFSIEYLMQQGTKFLHFHTVE